MEQPTNGHAPAVVLELSIQWGPSSGQFAIRWPQVDDVIKLGMLQMAIQVLTEARVKANATEASSLVIPAKRIMA